MKPFPNFDIKAAAERLNKENRIENQKIAQRRSAALREAAMLAEQLRRAQPTVTKIYGFGSTFFESMPYRLDSDIDLAIEGGDLIALLRIAESSSFPVDLVDISGQTDEFAARIRREGRVLFSA